MKENATDEIDDSHHHKAPWFDSEDDEDLPTVEVPVGASDSEHDESTIIERALHEIYLTEHHKRLHLPMLPDICEVCRRAKRCFPKCLIWNLSEYC